ncbi:MAG: hypothetical protein HYT22_02955 [Candidatus Niyogibacteria bacterium]|nr:hypothetical protein [Candidatus Niyogibacteria bacterium]
MISKIFHPNIMVPAVFVVAGGAVFLTWHVGNNAGVAYVAPKIELVEERATHLKTPEPVRAIYMTSWVAGDKAWREKLVKFIDRTELNAIVVDVKDYTGRVAFETDNPYIRALGASKTIVPDIREFIRELHSKNIYAIARISVFQDPYFLSVHPEYAVKTKSGAMWKDKKGIPWVDPAAKDFWNYIVALSAESERAGFDEINFDYIRFPSDGNMRDIAYDYWDEVTPPAAVIKEFFAYLRAELDRAFLRPRRISDARVYIPTPVPLSVDMFGMVTVNTDDLNIGQVLENAAPYFDYIAPMVYPSHYPPTYKNFGNPAAHPYEIIYDAMSVASRRLIAASSTPAKLRPWLQDFDLGADYDAVMVRKEMQAVYDAGLTSWMAWDAANRYTQDAYRLSTSSAIQ